MGAVLEVSDRFSAAELARVASKERRPKVRERILIFALCLRGIQFLRPPRHFH